LQHTFQTAELKPRRFSKEFLLAFRSHLKNTLRSLRSLREIFLSHAEDADSAKKNQKPFCFFWLFFRWLPETKSEDKFRRLQTKKKSED
jgi:hypothetical protein